MAMWNRPTTSENMEKVRWASGQLQKRTRIVVRYAYVIFSDVFEARTSLVSEALSTYVAPGVHSLRRIVPQSYG